MFQIIYEMQVITNQLSGLLTGLIKQVFIDEHCQEIEYHQEYMPVI